MQSKQHKLQSWAGWLAGWLGVTTKRFSQSTGKTYFQTPNWIHTLKNWHEALPLFTKGKHPVLIYTCGAQFNKCSCGRLENSQNSKYRPCSHLIRFLKTICCWVVVFLTWNVLKTAVQKGRKPTPKVLVKAFVSTEWVQRLGWERQAHGLHMILIWKQVEEGTVGAAG